MRTRRIVRLVGDFTTDHPDVATRDQADQLLRDIELGLEDGLTGDRIRDDIGALRRDFKLGSDQPSQVPDFTEFVDRIEALQYRERLTLREQAQTH